MVLGKLDRLAVLCAAASLSLLAVTCEQPTESIQTAPPEPQPFPRHLVGRFVNALAARDQADLAKLMSPHTQLSYAFESAEEDAAGCAEHGLALSELLAKMRFQFDPNAAVIAETPSYDEVRVTLTWPSRDGPEQRGFLTLVYWRSVAATWQLKNVRLKELAGPAQ